MKSFVIALVANLVIFGILMLLDARRSNWSDDLSMGLPLIWLAGIDVLIFLGLILWYRETAKLFLLFAAILFLIGFSLCSSNWRMR